MVPNYFTIIIKPTHLCNLSCKYCYVNENAEGSMMNEETLLNSIVQPMKFFGEGGLITYIWHGGEPLLMGVDFYKKALFFQEQAKNETGCDYSNCIQSNCTLLNDEWIGFFKKNHFSVGSSVDGPKSIHDKQRVFSNDEGTLDLVLEKINLAKSKNLRINTIAVITKNTINQIDEFYNFFKSSDLSTKINVLVNSGEAINNLKYLEVTPIEYGQFLIDLFDRWINEEIPILNLSISLNRFISETLLNKGFTCDFTGNCQKRFISIGPKGDIYPCGRFDGLSEFHYGNVNEIDGFKNALNNELRIKLMSRGSNESCLKCDVNDICKSGCMHNAYLNGDIMGRDTYCLSRKMIYSHVKKFLQTELSNAWIE